MKSFLYGLAISVPMTAAIVFFALQGRQDVVIQQKAHEVQQQIQSEELRRDFAEAWYDFDNPPSSSEERAEKEGRFEARQEERDSRIAQLKRQRELLSQDLDASFEQMDQDLDDMRAALRESQGIPPRAN